MGYQKYNLSFTSASLRPQACAKLARLKLDGNDWDEVRAAAVKDNLLQQRTDSSSKTLVFKLCSRLQYLSDDELKLLVDGSYSDQLGISWLAVCRRYAIIREFVRDVIHEKYQLLDYHLPTNAFHVFYNDLASIDEHINSIKDSTRTRMRQMLFNMLREVGLLDNDNQIQPVVLTPHLLIHLQEHHPDELMLFLFSNPNN